MTAKEKEHKFEIKEEPCPFVVCGCTFKGGTSALEKHLVQLESVRKHADDMATRFRKFETMVSLLQETVFNLMETVNKLVDEKKAKPADKSSEWASDLLKQFGLTNGGSELFKALNLPNVPTVDDLRQYFVKDQVDEHMLVQDQFKRWQLGQVWATGPSKLIKDLADGHYVMKILHIPTTTMLDATEEHLQRLDIPMDIFETSLCVDAEVDAFYMGNYHSDSWTFEKNGGPLWFPGIIKEIHPTDNNSLLVTIPLQNGERTLVKYQRFGHRLLPRGTITGRVVEL